MSQTIFELLEVDIEGAEVELFRRSLEWLNRVNAVAIDSTVMRNIL